MIASSIMMGRALAPIEVALSTWKQLVAARQGVARLRDVLKTTAAPALPQVALPRPRRELSVQDLVVAAPGTTPNLQALRAHCKEALADYKAPDALVVVDDLPLTPMMKVDPVRLGELAERGATAQRSARERDRRDAPGMLGSEPTGTAGDKERA